MKVRMLVDIGGYRNFVLWPRAGGVIDVPADEAADLVEQGNAAFVIEDEVAVAPSAPERAVRKPANRRKTTR